MNRPSAELLAEVFPDVRLTGEVSEFGTLLAIDRARKVLGFEPRHTWRNHILQKPTRHASMRPQENPHPRRRLPWCCHDTPARPAGPPEALPTVQPMITAV
jgi:hypothetical protein